MMTITVHRNHRTIDSRRRKGLQTQTLPREGSVVGSDWRVQVFQSRCDSWWRQFNQPEQLSHLQAVLRGKRLSFVWFSLRCCLLFSHQETLQPGCIFSVPSCQCQEWASLKLCLLPAKAALVLQIHLAEQELQLYLLGGIPSPPISSIYIQKGTWQL